MVFVSGQYTLKSFQSNVNYYIDEKQFKLGLCIGGVILCIKQGLNLARRISMSGNSNNPIIKALHNHLKLYLNCGLWVRAEFSILLPWQFFILTKGSNFIINYGSFGIVPIKVLEYQYNLLRQVEYFPDFYFRFTFLEKYEKSRTVVAKAVGCKPENLVFVENTTEGINCSLRSFLRNFGKNDSILCLRSIGYSAVLKAIDVLTKEYNVKVTNLDIQFPILSKDDFCAQFEAAILMHPSIKLAIFDHITSASSVVLPIHELGIICRKYNVISVVDGAHAPGQLFLDIETYDVDVYLGNLHKWYYTPKGCGFMYVKSELHDQMQPSLVSHHAYLTFHQRFRSQGTKSYSAILTASYAVGEFMENIGGISHLHSYISPLVDWAVQLFIHEWDTEEIQTPSDMKAPYMRTVYLPDIYSKICGFDLVAADKLMKYFLQKENIAVYINPVQGRLTTRVSAQIVSRRGEYIHVAKVVKKNANKKALQEIFCF